jgi:hypothetical protein
MVSGDPAFLVMTVVVGAWERPHGGGLALGVFTLAERTGVECIYDRAEKVFNVGTVKLDMAS